MKSLRQSSIAKSGGICALAGLLLLSSATLAAPGQVDKVLEHKKAADLASARSQAKIDALSERSAQMVQEYRGIQEALLPIKAQNAQLERLLKDQAATIRSMEGQVGEVAKLRQAIEPLLKRMLDALDEFVALDLPFLKQERKKRSSALHQLLADPKASLAAQTRRLFEAYMVELEYGRTLEAYEEQISLEGESIAVELLRVGRVGLYYLSLDKARVGWFNPQRQRFEALDEGYLPLIKSALQVAKKRIPPQLIEIPLSRSARAKGVRS